MFKRLGHIFLIVALLMATGSHWALLQSVAWTNMLVENLHSYSFQAAVIRTFDGKHPCRLCCQIAEGKKSEKKTEVPVEIKKLEFVQLTVPIILTAPRMLDLELRSDTAAHSLTHRPLSPPPRSRFV